VKSTDACTRTTEAGVSELPATAKAEKGEQGGSMKPTMITEAEGGGGVEGGSAEVGQPDGAQKKITVVRVSRRRGYSPYTRYIIGIG
jgi:hypothetical protein